ncbi:type IV pilus modification protein PilV [Noviherbaspirillum sp. UKPF54]|uniref:type IV pilus modification protein PilV n=1 Tax=Noviherbaspirillum sp. UKPF54 TaxID=2601898 RepID=UPI0011B117F7|nr:type IV pilus modification protein PilV [Noviherbaspirillum sp. UKPF54]QDZ26893.1 type IV pilus modification protein PilV [Noviherbaspirillum sp. UKPF54]
MKTTTSRQEGIVLIESLVAILVFSVGILGIVGLLAASIRSNADARYRNDASMLANQVIGQMWAGDKSNAALKANFESPGGPEYASWKTTVAGALPGVASNAPTIGVSDDNVATVRVQWQAPGDAVPHSYVLVARING